MKSFHSLTSKRQQPEPGKTDLLLRLFESDFFNEWIAIQYLYQCNQPGVQDYLCNKLHDLPHEAIERYLLQLVYLSVSRPGQALEHTILTLCSKSFKLAVKVHWLLVALCQDNPKSKPLEALKDLCERTALDGTWVPPFRTTHLQTLSMNLSPGLGMGAVVASDVISPEARSPEVSMHSSPTGESPCLGGKQQAASGGSGILPRSSSAICLTYCLDLPAHRPSCSQESNDLDDCQSLPLLTISAPRPRMPSPLIIHNLEKELQKEPPKPEQQLQQREDNSKEAPSSPLKDRINQIKHELGEGEGVTTLLEKAESHPIVTTDVDAHITSCFSDDEGDITSPRARARHQTLGSTLDFMEALCEASSSLTRYTQDERQGALRHGLDSINKDIEMAAKRNVSIWFPMGRNSDRVIRLAATEAVLLTSREKAPFMLFVEVVEDDQDENATSTQASSRAVNGDRTPTTSAVGGAKATDVGAPLPIVATQVPDQIHKDQLMNMIKEQSHSRSASSTSIDIPEVSTPPHTPHTPPTPHTPHTHIPEGMGVVIASTSVHESSASSVSLTALVASKAGSATEGGKPMSRSSSVNSLNSQSSVVTIPQRRRTSVADSHLGLTSQLGSYQTLELAAVASAAEAASPPPARYTPPLGGGQLADRSTPTKGGRPPRPPTASPSGTPRMEASEQALFKSVPLLPLGTLVTPTAPVCRPSTSALTAAVPNLTSILTSSKSIAVLVPVSVGARSSQRKLLSAKDVNDLVNSGCLSPPLGSEPSAIMHQMSHAVAAFRGEQPLVRLTIKVLEGADNPISLSHGGAPGAAASSNAPSGHGPTAVDMVSALLPASSLGAPNPSGIRSFWGSSLNSNSMMSLGSSTVPGSSAGGGGGSVLTGDGGFFTFGNSSEKELKKRVSSETTGAGSGSVGAPNSLIPRRVVSMGHPDVHPDGGAPTGALKMVLSKFGLFAPCARPPEVFHESEDTDSSNAGFVPAPKLVQVMLEVAAGVNLVIPSPARKSRRTPSHEAISLIATKYKIKEIPSPMESGPPLGQTGPYYDFVSASSSKGSVKDDVSDTDSDMEGEKRDAFDMGPIAEPHVDQFDPHDPNVLSPSRCLSPSGDIKLGSAYPLASADPMTSSGLSVSGGSGGGSSAASPRQPPPSSAASSHLPAVGDSPSCSGSHLGAAADSPSCSGSHLAPAAAASHLAAVADAETRIANLDFSAASSLGKHTSRSGTSPSQAHPHHSRTGNGTHASHLATYPAGVDPVIERKRREASAVFGERWAHKVKRIQRESPMGQRKGWALRCVIVKNGDDCRQEHLALQLIRTFQDIFRESGLPLWVRYYDVLITSNKTALIEMIPDALSIHTIKARSQDGSSLSDHFFARFVRGSAACLAAQRKFTESLASYSIITYLLQVKDRHNGNILLDEEGHVVHIDFGFLLSNSPGGVNFESAPFKLTRELLEIMDSNSEGKPSELFDYFKVLMIQGFLACRKHHDRLVLLVKMMGKSGLPCFKAGDRGIKALEKRFHLHLTEVQSVQMVLGLISDSLDAWRTRQYDYYQRVVCGIL